MSTTAEKIREAIQSHYSGSSGDQYHATHHTFDNARYAVIAEERRIKLSQFIGANQTVLEYGVGTGANIASLQCALRVGYDLSTAGRDKCAEHGIEFTNSLSDLRNRTFDVILCHHMLEHSANPVEELATMAGLLSSTGKLVLCVPFETNSSYRGWRADEPNHHLFSWNAQSIGNLVTACGFRLVTCRVSPFGYAQRFATLGCRSMLLYRCTLWAVRLLRPTNEILVVAVKTQ